MRMVIIRPSDPIIIIVTIVTAKEHLRLLCKRCRANMTDIRQSRPDSCLVLEMTSVISKYHNHEFATMEIPTMHFLSQQENGLRPLALALPRSRSSSEHSLALAIAGMISKFNNYEFARTATTMMNLISTMMNLI